MSNLTKFGEATGEQMTLFSRVASPDLASHTAAQESDLERKMTATSGRRCLEQFERFDRATLWAKTFAALLIGTEGWYSTKCRLTWKMRATKSHRIYFQLVPSTLPTDEIGFGLLPTIQTQGIKVCDKSGKTQFMDLNLLPTPTKVQRDHPERVQALKASGAKTIQSRNCGENRPNSILDDGMLPTPTATSDKNGGCTRTDESRQNDTLAHAVHGVLGEPGKTSQLNPPFVAEMMGFPPDWLELPFQSTEKNQSEHTGTP